MMNFCANLSFPASPVVGICPGTNENLELTSKKQKQINIFRQDFRTILRYHLGNSTDVEEYADAEKCHDCDSIVYNCVCEVDGTFLDKEINHYSSIIKLLKHQNDYSELRVFAIMQYLLKCESEEISPQFQHLKKLTIENLQQIHSFLLINMENEVYLKDLVERVQYYASEMDNINEKRNINKIISTNLKQRVKSNLEDHCNQSNTSNDNCTYCIEGEHKIINENDTNYILEDDENPESIQLAHIAHSYDKKQTFEKNDNISNALEFELSDKIIDLYPYIKKIRKQLSDIELTILDQKINLRKKQFKNTITQSQFRRDFSRRYKLYKSIPPTALNLDLIHYEQLKENINQLHLITNSLKQDVHNFNYEAQMGSPKVPKEKRKNFNFFGMVKKKAADTLIDAVAPGSSGKLENIVDGMDTMINDGKVERVMDFVLRLESSYDNFISNTAELYNQFNMVPFMGKMLLYLNKVYLFLRSIFNRDHWGVITCTLINLLEGTIPSNSLGVILDNLKENLNRAYIGETDETISNTSLGINLDYLNQDLDKLTAQGGESIPNGRSIMGSVLNAITLGFKGLFTNLTDIDQKDFEFSTKKLATFTTSLRAVTYIQDFVLKIFSFFSQHLQAVVLKHYKILPEMLNNFIFGEEEIYQDFIEIEKEEHHIKCTTRLLSANKIIAFRNKLIKIIADRKNKPTRLTNEMRYSLNYFLKLTDTWKSKIPPALLGLSDSSRDKPIFVSLSGPSGIGKTSTLTPLIAHKLINTLDIADRVERWDALVYTRNLGQEYWEGYVNQPICIVTDAFQEKTDEQKLNCTITELTRMNDTNTYDLNMAFQDKGKTRFTSQILIVDSQFPIYDAGHFNDRIWSNGKHILRRIDFSVKVELSQMYRNGRECGINYEVLRCQMNNPKNADKAFPDDLYFFTITNPETKEIIIEFDDINKFLEYIATESKKIANRSKDYENKLKNMFQKMYNKNEDQAREEIRQDLSQFEISKEEIEEILAIEDPIENQMFEGIYNYLFPIKRENKIIKEYTDCTCDLDSVQMWYTKYDMPIPDPHMCFPSEELFRDYYLENPREESISTLIAQDLKEMVDKAKKELLNVVDLVVKHPLYAAATLLSAIIAGLTIGVAIFGLPGRNAGDDSSEEKKDKEEQNEEIDLVEEIEIKLSKSENEINKPRERIIIENNIEEQSAKKEQKFQKKGRRRQNIMTFSPNFNQDFLTANITEETFNNNYKFLLNSMASLQITHTRGNDTILAGNFCITNIGGNVFMCPRHGINRIKEVFTLKDSRIVIRWFKKNTTPIHILPNNIKFMETKLASHLDDVSFFQIKNMEMGRNLAKHFTSHHDYPNTTGSYLYGLRSLKHECNKYCKHINQCGAIKAEFMQVSNVKEHWNDAPVVYDSLNYITHEKNLIEVANFYSYDEAYTVKGDCGMLLMHNDEKYPNKIMGIHTAGQAIIKKGISSMVFRDDIEDAISYFDTYTKQDNSTVVVNEIPVNGMGANCLDLDLVVEGKTNFLIHPDTKKSINTQSMLPHKTKFQESVIFDWMEEDFGPHTKEPVNLNKITMEDGTEISPLKLSIVKNNKTTDYIDNEDYEIINQHIIETITSYNTKVSNIKTYILTIDQGLNGVPNILASIEMNTSAGFPYTKLAKKSNKLPWVTFTEEENLHRTYQAKDFLREQVEDRINLAKQGIIKETYFVDCLKDETRTLDKIAANKVRMFQVGPFDLCVAIRMYYGFFMAHCHLSHLDGEISIGINPTSLDWDFLYRRLRQKNRKFICGDYKSFDASITHQMGTVVANAANAFYNDDETNQKIRRVLLATLFNTDHLMTNLWYQARQGHPSGDALTTIINCVANMFLFRYTYIYTVDNDLHLFHSQVSCAFYGDDNIVTVVDEIIDKFNMKTHQKIMETLNIEYTNTAKTDVDTEYVELKDAEYMSRRFVKHPKEQIIMSQMKYTSVLEIPRWCSSNVFNIEDQISRMNATLQELYSHGKEKFEHVREVFVKYCDRLSKGQIYDMEGKRIYLHFEKFKLFQWIRAEKIWYPHLHNEEIIDLLKYQTQMDEEEEVIANTTFVEENEIENETIKIRHRVKNTMPEVNLEMFLQRPIEILSLKWDSSANIGTKLFELEFPKEFIKKTPALKCKLDNIAFWRPDFVITIRINGTMMHYGRIVLCWIPQASLLSKHYKEFYNCFSNQWIQIDANTNESVEIKIPYTHYKNYIKINDYEIEMFTLYCYVSVPLHSINTTTCPISLSVFAYVSDAHCAGYTYTVQMDDKKLEGEQKTKKGITASGIFKGIGNFTAGFTSVPIIGDLAKPITSTARSMASILSYFGLSVPANETITNPFQIRPARMLQTDDTPSTIVLAPQTNCSLVKDFTFVNDKMESTSILSYVQRSALLYTGQILDSNLSGTVIYTCWITPTIFNYSDYFKTIIDGYHLCTPIMYMSRLFSYWRGGVRFHISFIKSHFHSCRLRLFYVPYVRTNTALVPTINYQDQLNLINTIIDVSVTKYYSFTIPFMQDCEWMQIWNMSERMNPNIHSNGFFSLSVVNVLTSGAASITPIFFQVFVSAAADFQLSMPNSFNTYDIGGFEAQMDDDHDPALAYNSLSSTIHKSLGGIDSNFTYVNSHQYYVPTSIKQLANMLCPFDVVRSSLDRTSGIRISVTKPINDNIIGASVNYLINVMSMFRYFRGGIRVHLYCNEHLTNVTSHVRINKTSTNFIKYISTQNIIDYEYRHFGKLTSGLGLFNHIDAMPFDIVIPWYSKYRCYITSVGGKQVKPDSDGVCVDIQHNSQKSSLISLSGADDFIFGFQLGCPSLSKLFSTTDSVAKAKNYRLTFSIADFWLCGMFPAGKITDVPDRSLLMDKTLKGDWADPIGSYVLTEQSPLKLKSWITGLNKCITKKSVGTTIIVTYIIDPINTGLSTVHKNAMIDSNFPSKCPSYVPVKDQLVIISYTSETTDLNYYYIWQEGVELEKKVAFTEILELHIGDQSTRSPNLLFEVIQASAWGSLSSTKTIVSRLILYYKTKYKFK